MVRRVDPEGILSLVAGHHRPPLTSLVTRRTQSEPEPWELDGRRRGYT